jgi:phenylpropionate dioxygenase-like ring-hydroxylating dioxygenase large terminal subunit
VIENFLDLAHLCFVHEGILGMSDRAEIEDYQVIKTDKGVEALDIRIWQPAPIVGTADTTAHYTYKVLRPLAAYLDKVAEGQRFSMLIVATPLEETESLAWILTGMTGAEDMPEADMHAFMEKIFMQDVPIMESQKPERLPLDLQQELHLRCDRTSIAYRQWLNELGLSFGTS